MHLSAENNCPTLVCDSLRTTAGNGTQVDAVPVSGHDHQGDEETDHGNEAEITSKRCPFDVLADRRIEASLALIAKQQLQAGE